MIPIDWTKPIHLRTPDGLIKRADYIGEFDGMKVVKVKGCRYAEYLPDGRMMIYAGSSTTPQYIFNVPVLHTRTMVIYDYKGGECCGAFLSPDAARAFFTSNPGRIIGMKEVTVEEGEGI